MEKMIDGYILINPDHDSDVLTVYRINDQGKKVPCKIIRTCVSGKTGNSIVLFIDKKKIPMAIYASAYNPDDGKLIDIQDEQDWECVQKVMEELKAEKREQLPYIIRKLVILHKGIRNALARSRSGYADS